MGCGYGLRLADGATGTLTAQGRAGVHWCSKSVGPRDYIPSPFCRSPKVAVIKAFLMKKEAVIKLKFHL